MKQKQWFESRGLFLYVALERILMKLGVFDYGNEPDLELVKKWIFKFNH